jgi:RND family efflux transporter MFP subunit
MNAAPLYGMSALALASMAIAAAPPTFRVGASVQAGSYEATGTIQAVRQGTMGAQISGRVVEVLARSGDSVTAGQPLIRIEADDAKEAEAASVANASGAAARLATARADFERAQRLRAQDYISVAAMQRVEAQLHSAEAEDLAATAAVNGARTRAGWRTVRAPYAGLVTDLLVATGDLATPGKPMLTVYDPAALRVIAHVPESVAARLQRANAAHVMTGASEAPIAVSNWAVVSAVDPATHSVAVRAELPAGTHLQPGQFVRVQLPLNSASEWMRIPARAVIHRSDVTAVYVIDASGAAHLRQIRLGSEDGDSVAVLSGLQSGELIALDPVAAGRR